MRQLRGHYPFHMRLSARYPIYLLRTERYDEPLEVIQSEAPRRQVFEELEDIAAEKYPEEYLQEELYIQELGTREEGTSGHGITYIPGE